LRMTVDKELSQTMTERLKKENKRTSVNIRGD
jgi:hypothetical protein